jgi:hypothetical protein
MAGSWLGYHEWVTGHEMRADLLRRKPMEQGTLQDLGAHIGIALAGDGEARSATAKWLADPRVDEELKSTVLAFVGQLEQPESFQELLAFLEALAKATREQHDDDGGWLKARPGSRLESSHSGEADPTPWYRALGRTAISGRVAPVARRRSTSSSRSVSRAR